MLRNTRIETLRWVLFIPIAVTGAYSAEIISNAILGSLFLLFFVDAAPVATWALFIAKFLTITINQYVVAAGFVYFGGKTAPYFQKTVALSLASVGFAISLAFSLPAILSFFGWAIWQTFCTGVGAFTIVFLGHTNRIQFRQNPNK